MSAATVRGLRRAAHQLRYPREFRIADPGWASEQLDQLDGLLNELGTVLRESGTRADPKDDKVSELADVSLGLWRSLQRISRSGDEDPPPSADSIRGHLIRAQRALIAYGVTTQDHEEEPYDPSQSLEVVAFQETADVTRNVVVDTVKPSIYFHGTRIREGQVIVGTPLSEQVDWSSGDAGDH